MWELICHHEYCWGTIAADRSPWHSDGRTSFVDPLSGENGLRFSQPRSQIAIPPSSSGPWNKLDALIVEMTVRLKQPGCTLIDIDQSFRIWLSSQRILFAQVAGHDVSVIGVPLDRWIRLRLRHNGLNGMGFSYEDVVAGGGLAGPVFNVPPGRVPGAGPQGVMIGNRLGHPNEFLRGDIASVKIWRPDPNSMITTFLGRPFTPPLLECWGNFSKKIGETLKENPECGTWIIQTLERVNSEFFKKLGQLSPDKVAQFRALCSDYQKLWAAGKVGSSEMKDLVARLRDWLKSENLFSLDDEDLRGLFNDPCFKNFTTAVGGIECDPEVQTLLTAILGV